MLLTHLRQDSLNSLSVDMAFGRSAKPVDLKVHLEELEGPVERDDFWGQTDEFLVRPPTPPFVPARTGSDVATQVEPWEVS